MPVEYFHILCQKSFDSNFTRLSTISEPLQFKTFDQGARELVTIHSTAQVHVWRLSILFEISHQKIHFQANDTKQKELQKWE
jgi:hypothetical protein